MFDDQPVRGELDEHVENMLDLLNDYDITLSKGTPEDAREQLTIMTNLSTGEPEAVDTVEDVEIPPAGNGEEPIPARVYAPAGDGHPTVTFFHGGGFVAGDIDTHDELCRMLANRAEAVIVSVEYRKAPEAPWPEPIKDAYAGAQWTSRNADEYGGDTSTHVVAGDSAGGNLSAVVSLMAAERGMPNIDRQLLLYPATTYMDPMPSRAQNGDGYFLTAQDMLWFVKHYIDDEIDAHHPWAFPLNARRDKLAETPPAFVLTCGFDPLRDEGHAYAQELAEAGVDVEYSNHESMIHGFLNMEGIVDHTYEGVEEVAEQIRKA
ncbi:alpha/beta hydrolase [Halorientalis regularis]|jgi:acetyl esterase|uniref:Acetyl esterase n=1 Tax=Halorientalis regularis TaxID=660518 RepID=A0A1G7P9B0_9EURY|nr:alpha/beta hydrolase [Halorientalis regularis]SDF82737.1 acetyl esterase [Halorientalis regularis]